MDRQLRTLLDALVEKTVQVYEYGGTDRDQELEQSKQDVADYMDREIRRRYHALPGEY